MTAEKLKSMQSEIASFEAVLLSQGVNPNDITGEYVQCLPHIQPTFDRLRKTLEEDPVDPFDDSMPPSESVAEQQEMLLSKSQKAAPKSAPQVKPKAEVKKDEPYARG